jgi:broad specificity phosphatase PhoE
MNKTIVLIRHGESFDDIYNEFGAWNNRTLTPQGILTAYSITASVKRLGSFDIIYTSPLNRASETAKIMGDELNLRVEEDKYLIERNTYGLLAGVNRDLAVGEYPELNAALIEGKYIHGAERYVNFQTRMAEMLQRLINTQEDKILCVTHGYVITEIIDTYLGKVRNSLGPGAIIEFKVREKKQGNKDKKERDKVESIKHKYEFEISYYENITFTDNEDIIRSLALRKFNIE